VPRRAKVAILMAGLWVLSPIDLLPEFLPVIGPLDDVLVVALALRYAARSVPRPVLLDAWPADPRLLELLLGPAATPPRRPGKCPRSCRMAHCMALGGVARPRRAVHFARLIERGGRAVGRTYGPRRFGGSPSLTWLLRSVVPGEPGPANVSARRYISGR
jgi:hypothetical protein